MSNHQLNDQLLLSVPIKDDEIYELLERLAATEEMFKTPVSTIRDVAELTEASPNLIARILGEMRGPGEYEKLAYSLKNHEERLSELEEIAGKKSKSRGKAKPFELKPPPKNIGNIPIIPLSESEGEDLLQNENRDDIPEPVLEPRSNTAINSKEDLARDYAGLLAREREIKDYRVIEGTPPAIKLLGLAFLVFLIFYILNLVGIKLSRPPIPPTYEFR